jgi:hypothetical protein
MSSNPRAQRQLQQQQQAQGSGSGSRNQRHVEAPSGSATQTETRTPAPAPPAILRLRGAYPASDNHVQWAESVVDNEGLGRKSSKGSFVFLSGFYLRITTYVKTSKQSAAYTTRPEPPASPRTSRRLIRRRRLLRTPTRSRTPAAKHTMPGRGRWRNAERGINSNTSTVMGRIAHMEMIIITVMESMVVETEEGEGMAANRKMLVDRARMHMRSNHGRNHGTIARVVVVVVVDLQVQVRVRRSVHNNRARYRTSNRHTKFSITTIKRLCPQTDQFGKVHASSRLPSPISSSAFRPTEHPRRLLRRIRIVPTFETR